MTFMSAVPAFIYAIIAAFKPEANLHESQKVYQVRNLAD